MNEDELRKAFMEDLKRRPEEFQGKIDLSKTWYGKGMTEEERNSFLANLSRLILEVAYHDGNRTQTLKSWNSSKNANSESSNQ